MTISNFCHLCNSKTVLHLCDCSSTQFINAVVQCRACGGNCSGTNCPKNSLNQKIIQARIQNQVRVSESQKIDVKSAVTITGDIYNNLPINPGKGSMNWGNPYNLRNMSDRVNPHSVTNNNVPTRGNSVRSSVTANKPGSMVPGGRGVDVKHDSYARYLGKLKASNIVSNKNGPFDKSESAVGNSVEQLEKENASKGSRLRPAMNNKQYRFSIIHTNNCCS